MASSSADLFASAQALIPGGVNSPVRAFGSVGAEPIYVTEAKGVVMKTADGDELIDFCGSWGPLILGHAPDDVVKAIQDAATRGTTYGINTPLEVSWAKMVTEACAGIDMVRAVNSGTEATMTALRLARGVTGKNKVIKCDGCYHGHHDSLLVSAGSGLLTEGISSSAGVSDKVVSDTLLVPYNDLDAMKQVVEANKDDLAAIIIEPIAGNMGLIEPPKKYLKGLRKLCDDNGALLIFDEVINGFRLGPSDYGTMIDIKADIICLGKIIGGGLPFAALGGSEIVMKHVSPLGPVYQAGTLSGNPLALAAGQATLKSLIETPPYNHIQTLGRKLAKGLESLAKKHDVALTVHHKGGMLTPFFGEGPINNVDDVKALNADKYAMYFRHMLEGGIYLPPSQFEVSFVCAAHKDVHIDAYLGAADSALQAVAEMEG